MRVGVGYPLVSLIAISIPQRPTVRSAALAIRISLVLGFTEVHTNIQNAVMSSKRKINSEKSYISRLYLT